MEKYGLVALGGVIGASLRYAVSEWFGPTDTFPFATITVNLVGSFCLGLITIGLNNEYISANTGLLVGTGGFGAFTTMSTFSVDTVKLLEKGEWNVALVYICVTTTMGPILALLGWKLGEMMFFPKQL